MINLVQQLCNEFLKAVRLDNEHHFQNSYLVKLFKELESINILTTSENHLSKKVTEPPSSYDNYFHLTFPDLVLLLLGVLSVEKVLPIWTKQSRQLDFENVTSPQKILETVRNVLNNKSTFSETVFVFSEEFNLGLNIKSWVTYEMYCVYEAAYLTLDIVLNGLKINDEETFLDDSIIWYNANFLSATVKAYTITDNSSAGEWEFLEKGSELIKIDIQKRLEFWEWWLTEAIPQAWQLAQETYQSQ